MLIHIALSAKLRKLILMQFEDLLIAVNDLLLSKDGINTISESKYIFKVSIKSFKTTFLCLKLYSILYTNKKDLSIFLIALVSLSKVSK